ncbi:hypothetical protein [Streptomyces qinglanensis]|uniref:Uncharacterized protein n=1 Tax=Streptomyces qinglanensis TaxID=943816 RepID=A0A1H9U439_9ACTN|nr:hypothetical protein [Streptomyces qinglanensis]SES04330.1 hypothetical protein SAMN05421870_107323 [Streptomyces qinglanensis]
MVDVPLPVPPTGPTQPHLLAAARRSVDAIAERGGWSTTDKDTVLAALGLTPSVPAPDTDDTKDPA